jgi:hypothetical protein
MADLILQKNGDRFASELINDRYQVLESSSYDGQYYVYDLVEDVIPYRNTDNSIMTFESVEAATRRINNEKPNSGNSARERTVKRMVQEVSNKIKKTIVKRESTRGATALSCLKDYLKANPEMTDGEIAEKVKEAFPDSSYNHSMVKYNRKKMYG